MLANHGAGFNRKILPSPKKLKEENRPGPSECAGRGPKGSQGAGVDPPGRLWAEGQTWQLPAGGSSDPAAYLVGNLRDGGASFPTSTLSQVLRVPDLPGPCPTAMCEGGACPFHRWEAGAQGGSPHALHGGPLFKRVRAPERVVCPAGLPRPAAGLAPWLGSPALSLASSHQGPSPEISSPHPLGLGVCPSSLCLSQQNSINRLLIVDPLLQSPGQTCPSQGLRPFPATCWIGGSVSTGPQRLHWVSPCSGEPGRRGARGHLRGGPGTS